MLQSNHSSLRSLQTVASNSFPQPQPKKQRSQAQPASSVSLEALLDSLPDSISSNKQAVINRLIALYEQGAIG